MGSGGQVREEGSNVFVSAHTSAGKTVVAEYSIALAKKHKRKAIYTSPIKALSNQKYRDFKEKFGDDVGIITGDVSLNPTASCLIVTTEVLRNMLYKGHDIVRDIAWVIFDEVHYVNNQERGVVWEETIILLPESIGLVMLSATVPNYMDFANWVGRTKQRKIYVERTLNRPVPLEHSIYYEGQLFVLKGTNEQFIQQNYDRVIQYSKEQEKKQKQIVSSKKDIKYEKKEKEIFKNTNQSQSAKARQKILNETYIKKTNKSNANTGSGNGGAFFGAQTDAKQVKALLKHCQKNDLLPCVVFVFSKNMIKNLSESLGSLSLITHEESKRIEEFFNRAARKLKPRDLEVHQIKTLKALMIKGIAVHHGDVIPFIKEVVEILFSQGLIKVLFATETFSMGINMPTKTVIFFAVKKFDSQDVRMLNSSEYTQMSGRAGRRGLDLKGNVIILITELKKLPTRQDLFKMMDNKGEMLSSKFKVNYELILKLLSSREIDVTEMIKKSYSENDKFSKLPLNLKKTEEVQKKLRDTPQIACSLKQITDQLIPIEEYYAVSKQLPEANEKYWQSEMQYLQNQLMLPCYCEFMDSRYKTYFGMIVQCIRQSTYQRYIVVLYICSNQSTIDEKPLFTMEETNFFKDYSYRPFEIRVQNSKPYICQFIELSTSYIIKIFDEGIDCKVDLRNDKYKEKCAFAIANNLENYEKYRRIRNKSNEKNKTKNEQAILQRLPSLSTLTPAVERMIKESLTEFYEDSLCNNCPKRQDHFNQIETREQYKQELDELMKTLDEDDLVQQKNFQARLKLLKILGYTDEENLPLLKARLAKELENIYVSEIIVRGILDELDEAELAAILMCFVAQAPRKGVAQYDPLNDDHFHYSERFIDRFTQTLETVNSTLKQELSLEILIAANPEELVGEIFASELVKVAYEWVKGKDFLHVSLLTEVQEGTIIRSMLRLDNLMKNIKNCVQYIGNNTLALKIESCQEKMRRDIIFAQSLYLEEDNK